MSVLVTNNKFRNVLQEVATDDMGKYDFMANLHDFSYNDSNGKIVYKDEDEFALTANAESQLYSQLNMPPSYIRKLPFSMVKDQFDYWQEQVSDKKLFVRAKDLGNTKMVRAFLSNKYNVLDNRVVAQSFLNVIDGQNYRVVNQNITDDMFNARIIFEDVVMDDWVKDSSTNVNRLYGGIHVSNGETGCSSVNIELIVFELICSNGCIKLFNGQSLLARRHVGNIDNLTDIFSNSMIDVKNKAEEFIDQFSKANEMRIQIPMAYQALESIAERRKSIFTKSFLEKTIAEYENRPIPTVYGLSAAITKAAQTLPFDRRLQMERVAGDLITGQMRIYA